jgi:hypothetical protein
MFTSAKNQAGNYLVYCCNFEATTNTQSGGTPMQNKVQARSTPLQGIEATRRLDPGTRFSLFEKMEVGLVGRFFALS